MAVRPLAQILAQQGYVAIPLDRADTWPGDSVQVQIPFIPAVIDSTPLSLMLDAGYSGSVALDKAMAGVLGIHGVASLGANGMKLYDTARVEGMTLGSLHLAPQLVSIVPQYPAANGALGAEFFAKHDCILDYVANVFYVRITSSDSASHSLPWSLTTPPGYVAIPLDRETRGRPPAVRFLLKATVDTTAVTLILDTGSNLNVTFDQHVVEALGLHVSGDGGAFGAFGHKHVSTGILNRLQLGTLHLTAVHFDGMPGFSAFQSADTLQGFPAVDGLIGAQVLAAHDAIIDFGRNVLYLRVQ
jgi:hypothetical protein